MYLAHILQYLDSWTPEDKNNVLMTNIRMQMLLESHHNWVRMIDFGADDWGVPATWVLLFRKQRQSTENTIVIV